MNDGAPGRGSPRGVLLLTDGEHVDECLDTVAGADPLDRDVIVVTHDRKPESVVRSWRSYVDTHPGNIAIIAAGDSARSSAENVSGGSNSIQTIVETVADPVDFSETTERLEVFVDEWRKTGNRTVVYFDSVRALVRFAGTKRTIDFLAEAVRLFDDRDCVGYFRYVASGADEDTISRLQSVVNRVDRIPYDDPRSVEPSIDPTSQGTPDEPSMSTNGIFDLFSDSRRRRVLIHFRRTGEPSSVSELATRIAEAEHGTVTDETRTRAYVGLRHVHLPKLEDAGVVSVDRDRNVVEPKRSTLDFLTPLIAFAAEVDGYRDDEHW